MVVVADTSPISYLLLIGQIDLLEKLYSRILIPPTVLAELRHLLAPSPVRIWANSVPQWVEVLNPASSLNLSHLGPGESEAIALASEIHADVLLIDERAGRQEALRRGLKVAATLSVLDEADQSSRPHRLRQFGRGTTKNQFSIVVNSSLRNQAKTIPSRPGLTHSTCLPTPPSQGVVTGGEKNPRQNRIARLRQVLCTRHAVPGARGDTAAMGLKRRSSDSSHSGPIRVQGPSKS